MKPNKSKKTTGQNENILYEFDEVDVYELDEPNLEFADDSKPTNLVLSINKKKKTKTSSKSSKKTTKSNEEIIVTKDDNSAPLHKTEQKEKIKISKDKKKELKAEVKKINKLNEAHNGPKDLTLNNDDNIIELKNVIKYYTNGFTVTKILKGIDLEIKKGDFVIILGPSGSGKTTLMNIISGLDRATDGVTNVCGKNLINLKDNELTLFRKENIGYVFQQYGLLPNLNVKENVEIGAHLQKDKSRRQDIDTILKSFGIYEQKDKFPHQLSGGQQQRVSIARAFAKNPTILFGDEPTGAIDEEMSKMVIQEFININKIHGTTVIIVTHNSIFESLGSLVIKFKNGEISSMYRNPKPSSVEDLPWGK